jgi:hypothetical protein
MWNEETYGIFRMIMLMSGSCWCWNCRITTGIHFNTTHLRLLDEIEKAVTIFGHGLELFVSEAANTKISLSPNLSCGSNRGTRWKEGGIFFKWVHFVSLPGAFNFGESGVCDHGIEEMIIREWKFERRKLSLLETLVVFDLSLSSLYFPIVSSGNATLRHLILPSSC